MTPIKIAIVGFGSFGQQLTRWLLSKKDEVKIVSVTDRDPTIINLADQQGLPVGEISQEAEVIVDCAWDTRPGAAQERLWQYQKLDKPAVFQNGESFNVSLFYTGLPVSIAGSLYLKIPKCSALATLNVALSLRGALSIRSIYTLHTKISGWGKVMNMDYESGGEIDSLLHIPARVDVVYLGPKGKGHSEGYVYHGNMHFQLPECVSLKLVEQALRRSPILEVGTQDINPYSPNCERGEKTIVVKNGVSVEGNIVRLNVVSFTPEINFRHNLAAIKLLARQSSS